jgi:hypothetical protein
VLVDGIRLASVGAIAGMVAALAVARLLGQLAPGGGSPTVWAWLAAPLVLLTIVGVAALLPTRQALMIDPLRAIRGD